MRGSRVELDGLVFRRAVPDHQNIHTKMPRRRRRVNHIGRATRFVVSGFPTLLILGPPLLILGPTLLILEPTWLILVVKMGIAIRKKTQTIQTVDSGFE